MLSLTGVLFALPATIAHLYGAGQSAKIGYELHQSLWVAGVFALVAILLLFVIK